MKTGGVHAKQSYFFASSELASVQEYGGEGQQPIMPEVKERRILCCDDQRVSPVDLLMLDSYHHYGFALC